MLHCSTLFLLSVVVVAAHGFVACKSRLPTTTTSLRGVEVPAGEVAVAAVHQSAPTLIKKFQTTFISPPWTPREVGIVGAIGFYILVRLLVRYVRRKDIGSRFESLERKFAKMEKQFQSLQDSLTSRSSKKTDGEWSSVTTLKRGKDGTWRPAS